MTWAHSIHAPRLPTPRMAPAGGSARARNSVQAGRMRKVAALVQRLDVLRAVAAARRQDAHLGQLAGRQPQASLDGFGEADPVPYQTAASEVMIRLEASWLQHLDLLVPVDLAHAFAPIRSASPFSSTQPAAIAAGPQAIQN